MAKPNARIHAHRGNHKQYASLTHQNPQKHMVPAVVLTHSNPVPITAVRPVSATVPKLKVTRPRHVKPIVTKSNSPTRRHITHSPSLKFSNSPTRVTAVKALVVNAAQGLQGKWEWRPKCPILDHGNPQYAFKDKGVIDSRCSRHMTENMSYNFKELNGEYVAFGGNLKGERMRSIISMVSISLEGFLPSILLLVVIIVAVVIVAVILVVVIINAIVGVVIIVASIGVVVVVMIIGIVMVDGGVSHIIKLLFMIIVFLLGLSAFSMTAAYASRAAATPSVISCRMVALVIVGVVDVDVLLGYPNVNTPRCDEDRIELKKLMVSLLPKVKKVRIRVNAVDLQVSAVRHMLLLRLQALVDKKKVVVTKATIREALHLDDEEGVECLPNEEIFAELARMGYEKPSAKLTFYKAFFSSQWKNVDSPTKFYMYPRFRQLMIRKQVGQQVVEERDDDKNDEVNVSDADEGDVSTAHGEIPTVAEEPSIPSPTPPTLPPQPSQDIPSTSQLKRRVKKPERRNKVRVLKLRRLQRVGTAQRVETSNETVLDDVSNQGRMIAEMDHDADVVLEEVKEAADQAKEVAKDAKEDETEPAEVQEVVDVVTIAKLITKVNSPSFFGRIVPLFDTILIQQGAGSGTPTEPHHTPSLEAPPSLHTYISSPSLPTVTPISTAPIPTVTPSETTPLRQYTRRARIAQSSSLPPVADESASPVRDVSQKESCPTKSGFIVDQDRTTIAKFSTLRHDSATRVTSPAAVKGNMQQTINELMEFRTRPQRQHSELLVRFQAQEVEINKLKEIVKLLEDGKGMATEGSGDDAPIKRRRLDKEEVATERVSSDTEEIRLDEREVAAEKVSDDTEELATVLITLDAASVLSSGGVHVVLLLQQLPLPIYTIHEEKGKRKAGGDSYTQEEEEIEEGEPIDTACPGGITSTIGAITSGAGGSTLGGGEVILNGDSPVPTRVVEDAKTPMKAIERRFGGNTETKKVQKTLLKEQYENFTGSNSESLDQIHDRLQKLVSQLEIHGSVSAAASVSVVCAKMHVSSLPNVDSLSNAVIYSFFASQSFSPQKGYFARKCRSPKDSRRNGSAKPQRRKEEPANYALMAFLSLSSSFDNEVFKRVMFDCDDYLSSESDESWPPSSLYDRFQPSDGYHAVPPPHTGTFMPPKPDLVFNTAPTVVETDHPTFTVYLSPTKPAQDLSHTNRPTTPIIEDWIFDSEDESETKAPQIVPSFV
nr:ribonuclease H-like domain-containing protein [Tanacetum cinerariifolium]